MTARHKIILLSILSLLTGNKIYAQDIHFSQEWLSPVLINPAQTGAETKMRGIILHRNQWKSVASPYVTSALSWDMELPHKGKGASGFSAIGVTIFHDKAGDSEMKTLQGNVTYAYHVFLNERSTLGAGIYAGFAQHSIDYTGLQWMSQYNGVSFDSSLPTMEPLGSTSFKNVDVGAGLHYAFGKGERYMTANDQMRFNCGLSISHINRPKNTFYNSDEKLPMKISGYANASIGIGNSNLSFQPGLFYFRQGKMTELVLGSQFRYSIKDESRYTSFEQATAISAGLHFRSKDAAIASVFFEIGKYAIGISYDINVSKLSEASKSRGGFEIGLRFMNPNPFGSPKSTPRI
jgi:type IX secretion system PorP/SprF family membrane protein